ncbi:hypothetical protein ACFX10_004146 [Malus domestica]
MNLHIPRTQSLSLFIFNQSTTETRAHKTKAFQIKPTKQESKFDFFDDPTMSSSSKTARKLQVALPVPADIDIANSIEPLHISEIAKELNLNPDHYDLYGKYKAKVLLSVIDELKGFGWVLCGG